MLCHGNADIQKTMRKKLIEYKTGNRPLFYLKFNSSANSAVFDCLHNPGQFTDHCLLFYYNAVVKV